MRPPQDAPTGEDVTAEDLLDLADGLLASWQAGGMQVRAHKREVDRLAYIVALAHHVHRLGAAYVCLERAGFAFEAIPLSRACYETALRVAWINSVEDAPEAMLLEHQRQHQILLASVKTSGWITDEAKIAELNMAEPDVITSSSARQVKAMCDDLKEAGDSAYTLYRALSARCHPSLELAETYVESEAGQVTGFRASVETWDPRLGSYPVCVALVWAGRAADLHDPDRSRRASLRAAARTLGIPEVLTLSDAAWVRVNRRKAH